MTTVLAWLPPVLLAVAALLVLARALRGPTALDRLLALESLALGVVGLLLLQARGAARLYLDAALALALLSFVATVVAARVLGRGEVDDA